MNPSHRQPGFAGEYLWELDIVERQLAGMAEALPPGQYEWRPDPKARSAGEILVHVAAGNLMLLHAIGMTIGIDDASDLYGQSTGMAMVHVNDGLERSLREKDAVVKLLRRSLETVRASFVNSDEAILDTSLHFFGEPTTVRRVYLRLLCHMHEHMGQLIAYFRCNGIRVPWPDWRPDRQ